MIRFFDWLDRRGIATLAEVDTRLCEDYLQFRRYVIDDDGTVVGEQSPCDPPRAAQIIVDLVDYRDLFTADRVRADLRPWGGATASAVAEMPSGRAGNKTLPVTAEVLQPMLAAALHLVQVLGQHVVELNEQIRQIDRVCALKAPAFVTAAPRRWTTSSACSPTTRRPARLCPCSKTTMSPADSRRLGTPTTRCCRSPPASWPGRPDTSTSGRWMPALRNRSSPPCNLSESRRFSPATPPRSRPPMAGPAPWTLPLHRSEAVALVGIVRTAAIIVSWPPRPECGPAN